MDFDHYSRATFEALATSPDALRARANQLQEDVLVELHRVLIERFATIVAELNQRGHKLTDYRDQTPDHGHVRDYTDPEQCALRLAFDLTISAGFEDVLFEGGRGETPGRVELLAYHAKSVKAITTHSNSVERYPGTLAELAEDLGTLRYDALAMFLGALSAKLEADSLQDAARGREKLATALHAASEGVSGAAGAIAKAWAICEPHM